MAKYIIWDKNSNVYTPSGEVFTKEQWLDRYGWINHPMAKPVLAGGLVNGAFCGELSGMIDMYSKAGANFSECVTDEDFLNVIELFEDAQSMPNTDPTTEERIASALEFQNILALDDATIS